MRKWGGVLLILALGFGAYTAANQAQEATGTIYGIAPKGYHVAIQGTSLSTVADPISGNFTIDNVPVGKFFLVVASDSSGTDVYLMGNVCVQSGGERVEVPNLVHVSPQTVLVPIGGKPEPQGPDTLEPKLESPYKLLKP